MFRRPRHARAGRALCAAGAVGLLTLAAASPSQAAFTLGDCEGSSTLGAGASFQNAAHDSLWRTIALPAYCTPFGGAPANAIGTYQDAAATGSGYGRRVMGERTSGAASTPATFDNSTGSLSRTPPRNERFGATDEPPDSTGVNQMNQGTNASGDEAQVRTIPVSIGAMATIVNLPDGCDFFNGASNVVDGPGGGVLAAANLYSAANTADRERIRLPKAVLEDIWAGDGTYDQWGDVFGDNLDGTTQTDTECREEPIVRVVRQDESGSTYVYKDYLRAIDPAEGWLTTYVAPTTNWPNPDRSVNGTDSLLPADAPGGGAVRTKVDGTDGSIGYVELSGARGGTGNPFLRQADATEFASNAGGKFWIEAQNGAGEFNDPASQTNGFTSSANNDKGARCSAVTFAGVPGGADPTLNAAGWTGVSGVNTAVSGQYGICSLTYILAWDDSSDAYGDSATEQARARTVKDYLKAIMSQSGQDGNGAGTGTGLHRVDQAPLPLSVRDVALDGVNAIDWCKGGCGDGGDDGGDDTGNNTGNNGNTGGGGGTPAAPAPPAGVAATPPPAPIVARPSSVFTIPSARRSGNNLVMSLTLPGPGRIAAVASGTYREKVGRRTRTRRLTVGRASLNVTRAGTVSVRLPISSRTRSALRKVRTISVTVRTTFTPVGGTANTVSKKVTLRGTRRARR